MCYLCKMRTQMLLIFFFFGLLASSSMAAEKWKKIEGGTDFDIYVDTALVQKTGNLVKISYLQDFKKGRSYGGFTSAITNFEIDCLKRQGRELHFAGYAQRMGHGSAKHNKAANPDYSQEWGDIADPEYDIRGAVFSFACGARK